ncbi:hypothetical protein C0989_000736 [Termitomyces sp. Mn162]|nr:hypothetical protein C0989_000736 [Termitomyces sp. Mn162]
MVHHSNRENPNAKRHRGLKRVASAASIGPGPSIANAINVATDSNARKKAGKKAISRDPGANTQLELESEEETTTWASRTRSQRRKLLAPASMTTKGAQVEREPEATSAEIISMQKQALSKSAKRRNRRKIGRHTVPKINPNAVTPSTGIQHAFPKVNLGHIDRGKLRQDRKIIKMRQLNHSYFGKAFASVSIQRADATEKKKLPSKEKVIDEIQDESLARSEAYRWSRMTYLVSVTPEVAKDFKLVHNDEGVMCYGCALAADTIQGAQMCQGAKGRLYKARLSRKTENTNQRMMVDHKDHLLPWYSLIWIRIEPGILHGRVSYDSIINGGEKPAFSWHTYAYGTDLGCTTAKFRAAMVYKPDAIGYKFILDPNVDRLSFADIVVDLLEAFEKVHPQVWLTQGAQVLIRDLVISPPPFWHYSTDDLKALPLMIPHPGFTRYIEDISQGTFPWFHDPYEAYVLETGGQLSYPGIKFIYGALLLFPTCISSKKDAEKAEADWNKAYELYMKIVNDSTLLNCKEEEVFAAFKEQFGNGYKGKGKHAALKDNEDGREEGEEPNDEMQENNNGEDAEMLGEEEDLADMDFSNADIP